MYITMILMFYNLKHKIIWILLIIYVFIHKFSYSIDIDIANDTISNAASNDNRWEEKRIMMHGNREKGYFM